MTESDFTKYLKTSFFALLFLFGVIVIHAQSADEIIEKYIKAIGGRESISHINSLYVVTESKMMGMKVVVRTTILNGKGVRTEMAIGDMKSVSVYTEKAGWIASSRDDYKIQQLPPDQVKAGSDQMYICGPLINYSARGFKASYIGTETVRKVKTFKVMLISPGNMISEYFFDAATFYLVKSIQRNNVRGKEMEMTTYYSNYRVAHPGYIASYTVETKFGIMSSTSNVTEVLVNQPVSESAFVKL